MGKYRTEGIGKNKKIKAERKKPLPLSLMIVRDILDEPIIEYKKIWKKKPTSTELSEKR